MPQAYVDSKVCTPCHTEIAAKWGKTGMANTYAPATSVPKFEYRHAPSGEIFTGNGTTLRRYQQGPKGEPVNVLEKTLEFRFGSGEHSSSYFGRDALGNLIELPVSWYSEKGGTWAMSPGFETAQHAGFTRKVNPQCLFCHNAISQAGTTGKAVGIDCQRCHGPGGDHAANPSRQTIVNPARLTPARRIEVCLQCHLETTNLPLPGQIIRYNRDVSSYRPGEPLTDYALYFDHAPNTGNPTGNPTSNPTSNNDKFEFSSAPYRLFQAACYRANPETLTCTTCHDPHGGDRTPAAYAKACSTCHAGKLTRQNHPTAATNCVACHMAERRPTDAIHVTVRDHFIQRRPAKSPAITTELNANNLPPYRGEVVPYYATPAPPQLDLYLAAAQVRNQANIAAGIPALEAALARYAPRESAPWLDLADALRRTNQLDKAAAQYREAITRDPRNWRTHYGLALADPTVRLQALIKALELAPTEPQIYLQLATVQDPISTLRTGIKAIPDSADLHNNLGTALLRTGNTKDAEAAFREALRLRPELAALHLNLASLLARAPPFAPARFEFEAALHLDPGSAEIHSAYGAALAAHTQLREAKTHLETALKLNPNLANTHNNLGAVLKRLGDPVGALREFQLAVKLDPTLPAARNNLAEALANRH